MATDIEKLVVQLSADMKQYQREIQPAKAITNAQASAIENRYRQMDSRLASIGQSSARALVAPLTGIAAALSFREVISYAKAWTKAQNSLAVAGVSAGRQADVLKQLYQLSLDNAAPLEATVALYGRRDGRRKPWCEPIRSDAAPRHGHPRLYRFDPRLREGGDLPRSAGRPA